MERVDHIPANYSTAPLADWIRTSSVLFCFAVVSLTVTLLSGSLYTIDLSSLLLGVALATFSAVVLFLSKSQLQLREQQWQAVHALDAKAASLLASEERFRQMADKIHEVFWMMDARDRKMLLRMPPTKP